MKKLGDVLLYVGLILILAAGTWLKVVFTWCSTAYTLGLIGFGTAIAIVGGVLSKRSSDGVTESRPKVQPPDLHSLN